MQGGYDDGYEACPCFWGKEPSSMVKRINQYLQPIAGLTVFDAGCGEGKNAAYFASQGAFVHAVDISELAIENARRAWPELKNVIWQVSDIRTLEIGEQINDVVVAYGLLHCLQGQGEVIEVLDKLQRSTKVGGLNVVCVFNRRFQDLAAHPGFQPFLGSHDFYRDVYSTWNVLEISDSDLIEKHPHNNIEHTHSMTRLIARKVN